VSRAYWKTRDGRILYIDEMTTEHLRNTVKMLESKGFVSVSQKQFYFNAPQPSGDGALLAFEREQAQVFEAPLCPQLDALRAELKKRYLEERRAEEAGG
jgi:hypothetical protein